jgi:hypothetical protein
MSTSGSSESSVGNAGAVDIREESIVEIRNKRHCVEYPQTAHLTEHTLLELEQSQPHYRLAQRNLSRWFYYLEDTFRDSFDTYLDRPDRDYFPSAFEERGSEVALSQADFEESHLSVPSSTDLFGFTARTPPPDVEVVIPVFQDLQSHELVVPEHQPVDHQVEPQAQEPPAQYLPSRPSRHSRPVAERGPSIVPLSDSSSDLYKPPRPRRRKKARLNTQDDPIVLSP